MLVFVFFLLTHLFQLSLSTTIVVDGVSKWSNPNVQVGDSVIFQHKYHYNLYIFKNEEAFSSCNFTQATLLTKSSSTSYIWHPSRPGFFFFSFNNGTNKPCTQGQKLAVKVSLTPPSPPPAAELPPPLSAPPISSGGIVSSSPAYPWPFKPREAFSPGPAPAATMLPATSPMVADKGGGGGGGIPFINSNPAVPLPTGEVDSATIQPLPTSGHHHERQMVGYIAVQRALSFLFFLMLL